MDAEENKASEIVSVGATEVVGVDSEVVKVDVQEVVDADGHTKKVVTTTKRVTTKHEGVPATAAASPVTKTAQATAAGPLAFVAGYESWVLAHTSLARNVETMLYIAPQLVPKRALEPEVATQTGYSLVGLLRLYHDYILYKSTAAETPATVSQQIVRAARVPLSIISHIQVLAEVIARKVGGDVGKWQLIVSLEIVKSVLRVLLLIQQRRAMLVRGGKYKGVESLPKPSAFARFSKKAPKQGARTGKTFGKATAAEPAPASEDAAPAVNTISFPDATLSVEDASRADLLIGGELCHIFRPVVYAVLRQRRPETSWTPVVASLAIELLGLAMSSAAVKTDSAPAPATPSTPSTPTPAQAEISARKMALLLYLLRDPVYANVTMPATGQAADVLDVVPVVGKVFRFATTAILGYYHQFHFYTSAS